MPFRFIYGQIIRRLLFHLKIERSNIARNSNSRVIGQNFDVLIDIFEISNDANPPTSSDPIYEQYYLAHTAYAIVPTDPPQNGFADFNLTLHYNYQPWLGGFYNTHGNSSLLAQNVSLFRFKQDETILRLKLCLHDNNQTGVGDYIVVCKEKVIY